MQGPFHGNGPGVFRLSDRSQTPAVHHGEYCRSHGRKKIGRNQRGACFPERAGRIPRPAPGQRQPAPEGTGVGRPDPARAGEDCAAGGKGGGRGRRETYGREEPAPAESRLSSGRLSSAPRAAEGGPCSASLRAVCCNGCPEWPLLRRVPAGGPRFFPEPFGYTVPQVP